MSARGMGGGGGGKRRKTGQAAASGRDYTVTIALPGSIVANAQTAELKTYLAGQVARAAVVFNVDEIVIFADRRTPGDSSKSTQVCPAGPPGLRPLALSARCCLLLQGQFQGAVKGASFDADVFLARILQYLETPQCVDTLLLLPLMLPPPPLASGCAAQPLRRAGKQWCVHDGQYKVPRLLLLHKAQRLEQLARPRHAQQLAHVGVGASAKRAEARLVGLL